MEIGTPDGHPSYVPSKPNDWPDLSGCTVQRGTNQWCFVEMDFVVQSQYEADGFAQYPAGQKHTPTSFTIVILNGASSQYVPSERGRVWVWNPELYINPSS